MPERRATVASKVGLHARPAAIFVKAASEQPASVTIVKVGSDADPVDASSILGIMTLGAEFGDEPLLGFEAALEIPAVLEAQPLPGWANEIGCTNWPQFLLKFIVSHPAVTCAIPATSQVEHIKENMGACYGALPDAAMRARMIAYVENL